MKKLEPRQLDDFIQHQVKYALKQDDKGNLTFKYDPALRSTEPRSPDWLCDYVDHVICPTLLIHGSESDMLAAEVATSMVSKLAFWSLVEIGKAGHSIPGDNPEAFEATVLKFFRGI